MKKVIMMIAFAFSVLLIGNEMNTIKADAVVTIKAKTKAQLKKAKKKAWQYYKKDKPFEIKGSFGNCLRVRGYLQKKVQKQNNLKWVDLPRFTTAKKLKNYKSEVKYLTKIVKELSTKISDFERDYAAYIKASKLSHEEISATVMETYFNKKMSYKVGGSSYVVGDYKRVYNAKYIGDCDKSSSVGVHIAKALGFETRTFSDHEARHGWMCIKAVDMDGTKYWKGVACAAYSLDRAYKVKTGKGTPYVDKEVEDRKVIEELFGIKVKVDENGNPYITITEKTTLTLPATGGRLVVPEGKDVKKVDGKYSVTYNPTEDDCTLLTVYIDLPYNAWRTAMMDVYEDNGIDEEAIAEELARQPATVKHSFWKTIVTVGEELEIEVTTDRDCTFSVDNGATLVVPEYSDRMCKVIVTEPGVYTVTATNAYGVSVEYPITIHDWQFQEEPDRGPIDMSDYFA